MGALGDFDSIEYGQLLMRNHKAIIDSQYKMIIAGIGNEESRKQYCSYTKVPEESLFILKDNNLHNLLNLSSGLQKFHNPYINLLLMCLGIESPGTLKEVIRGYLGDPVAKNLFTSNDQISIANCIKFKASLFNWIGKDNTLRPFELATLRLLNLVEVLSNWIIYMPYIQYLTQRGGTFIFNDQNNLIYSHSSSALLDYSQTMSNPLQYLDRLIINSSDSMG